MCGQSCQLLQVFTNLFQFITKCDKCYYKVRQLFLLQSAMVCYYKVRQLFYYKVRQVLLQSATGITKCDNFITKYDRYYKVRRLLQSATVHTLCETVLIPEVVILKSHILYDHYRSSKIRNFLIYKQNMISMALSEKMLIYCPYCSQWIYRHRSAQYR